MCACVRVRDGEQPLRWLGALNGTAGSRERSDDKPLVSGVSVGCECRKWLK